MSKVTSVIGWEPILPQLAVFFAIHKLGILPSLAPTNLFLHGPPGNGKTAGLSAVLQAMEYKSVGLVDCSTIDHVADLLGVVNLSANRLRGKAEMIEGELLKGDVLILDELLNTPEHVLPQFRLLLQGKIVVLAKPQKVGVKFFAATGNLSSDMLEGQAIPLDSPTADRFGMVISIPRFADMSKEDQDGILLQRSSTRFTAALIKAVAGIIKNYQGVSEDLGAYVACYVRSLAAQLKGSHYAFEGRRGQLLTCFALASLAFQRAQPARNAKDLLLMVAEGCLAYHKLCGVELDGSKLLAAHEVAFQAIEGASVDAIIASSPSLDEKMNLVLANLDAIDPVSKAAVIEKVISEGSITQKLALLSLVGLPLFQNQPVELERTVRRMPLPMPAEGTRLSPRDLEACAQMSPLEVAVFELCQGNRRKMDQMIREVNACLAAWI